MKTNFLETINNKKSLLIDSYVKQYGEKYRDRITNTINDIKFVFYINSERKNYISELVGEKLEIITTFRFLERLGFSAYDLKTNNESDMLEFVNPKVNTLLKAFFGDTVFNCAKEYRGQGFGIFSFLDYDVLEESKEGFKILSERMKVLKSLGLVEIYGDDYYEFSHSSYYKYLVEYYGKIAKIADEYAQKIEYRCNYLEGICTQIYYKNLVAKEKTLKYMVLELKDLLSEHARKYVDENPNFNLKDFPDLDLLCDSECLNDTIDSLGIGMIEVFSEDYDLALSDPEFSEGDKKEIIKWRNKYLKYVGIDIKEDADALLTNKAMDENKNLLPSSSVLERVIETKNKYELLYLKEAGSNMIIESDIDEIIVDNVKLMLDLFTGAFCSSIPSNGNLDITVFIDPFSSYESLDFDHIIDHEIRHAIEDSIYFDDGVLYNKSGVRISKYDENDEYCIETLFNNLNEVYTEMLTINAYKERWEHGEYIFTPEVYCDKKFGWYDTGSKYMDWFSNLEILTEGNEDELLQIRMDTNSERLYQFLSFEEWQEIDELIPDTAMESQEKLKIYSLKIGENIREMEH